jgi:uncharacterized protein YjiS (DUF1127 family)
LQASIDCQLCNLVKSASDASANPETNASIILSRDNGITKFRFSVWSASPISIHMLRDTTSLQLKLTGFVAQAAPKLVSALRLMARFVSCYVQTVHERNELSWLSYRSLQDIGLTKDDVEGILRRPILHRCWSSVNNCETKRCRNSIVCMAECRATPHPMSVTRTAIRQVDSDIR